jgi:hypothetical protein
MNSKKEKGRVPSAASCNEKTCLESSTGVVAPQTAVIATGKLRRELVADLLTLPAVVEGDEHFNFRREGKDCVIDYGFRRLDGSQAINLRVTFQDWHPQLSVPAMEFYSQLFDAGFLADAAWQRAGQNGRTILTAGNREAVREDLAEVIRVLDNQLDTAQDQRNWAAFPEDVVVTVEWYAVKPDEGFDE